MHQYRDFDSPKCPNCDHPVEKSSHVLRCDHPKSKAHFNSKIADITKCLSDSLTHPELQNSFIKILNDWRKGRTITPASFATTFGIRNAVRDQDQIGWDNFLLGRWSTKWQKVQQRHFKHTESQRSSLRWTTCIINKFIRTVWDIWDFRNSLVHRKGGVFQRATNNELDSQIRDEFIIGFDNLQDKDKYLYQRHTVATLTCDTINEKRHWLRSLRAARSALEVEVPIPPETQQLIVDFFSELGADT